MCQLLSLLVISVSSVHIGFAYRLTSRYANCWPVIGHFCFALLWGKRYDWSWIPQCKSWHCHDWNSVIVRAMSERDTGRSPWCCSLIGGRLAGCSMVGLAETVEVLVCFLWRRIVNIHDSRMSILLSMLSVLGCSRIWKAFVTRQVCRVLHEICNGLHSSFVDSLHHMCALLSPSCQSA